MANLFGITYPINAPLAHWMIECYLQDIREQIQLAHLAKLAASTHPAWYCPLLIRLGEMMIASGTYLKAHYSIQPALRTR